MTQNSFAEQARTGEEAISLETVSATLLSLSHIIESAPSEQQIAAFANSVGALGPETPGCRRMSDYFAQCADRPASQTAQELGVDWTLAFRGVNPAKGPKPPYAGAWIAADNVGVDVMLAINSRYVDKGLCCGSGRLNRMDYLGVEVEFIAHLLQECAAASSEEEREGLASEVAEFEDQFILSWLPRYRESVEATCKTEFWKGYLELLEAALVDVRDQCVRLAA